MIHDIPAGDIRVHEPQADDVHLQFGSGSIQKVALVPLQAVYGLMDSSDCSRRASMKNPSHSPKRSFELT